MYSLPLLTVLKLIQLSVKVGRKIQALVSLLSIWVLGFPSGFQFFWFLIIPINVFNDGFGFLYLGLVRVWLPIPWTISNFFFLQVQTELELLGDNTWWEFLYLHKIELKLILPIISTFIGFYYNNLFFLTLICYWITTYF